MLRRLIQMDEDSAVVGVNDGGREVVVYVLWGASWKMVKMEK